MLESLLLILIREEVFLRVLWFSPLLKNQHFQIPIRPGITIWMCNLQIVIYFIYLFMFVQEGDLETLEQNWSFKGH